MFSVEISVDLCCLYFAHADSLASFVQDRLMAHGVRVPEEEGVWAGEFNRAVESAAAAGADGGMARANGHC
jgi:hypothetical protein